MLKKVNRSVSMYAEEWDIVKRYARILQPSKPNVSAALRIIVREWRLAEGWKLAEMEAAITGGEANDE